MCSKLKKNLLKSGAQGDSSPVQASLQQETRPRVLQAGSDPSNSSLVLRTSREPAESDPVPIFYPCQFSRESPKKYSAITPGPVWEPMTLPT